jgi:inhibitor of KinA sporulation pathway (predicted exonuclease)
LGRRGSGWTGKRDHRNRDSPAGYGYRLRKEYGSQEYTWASYGAYDLNMMQSQCKARQVEYPLSVHHINVKELFREKSRMQKKVGMAGALAILDLPLEGTHHRGVDDARNIARILHWCLNKN